MLVSFTALSSCIRAYALTPLCLLIYLTLSSHGPLTGETPPGSKRTAPLPIGALPGTLSEGPLPRYRFSRIPLANNDPIRFRLQSNKQTVRLGEPVELTITAELLNVSPNLMFTLPGANGYRLKLLLPSGFIQTGGDFADYVGDELSYPSRPVATYHVTGYFASAPGNGEFRLLRSHAQADGQSLFVEKASIALKSSATESNRPTLESRLTKRTEPTSTLYVISEVTPSAGYAPSGARTAASQYIGYLEFAFCDIIGGWVADQGSPQKSVSLDIFINGAKVATIQANQDRQDVADALRTGGYNKYGYRWNVPDVYKRNAPLTFAVKVSDAPVELTGSPRKTDVCPGKEQPPVPPKDSCRFTVSSSSVSTGCGGSVTLKADCQGADCDKVIYSWSGNNLTKTGKSIDFNAPSTDGSYTYKLTATVAGCQTQTATTAVTVNGCSAPPVNPRYFGYLDSVSCDTIAGWAFDFNRLQQSVSIDVLIDGTKTATIQANYPRSDVADFFRVSGFNRYGYSFVIPDSLKKNKSLTISTRVSGSDYELIHSPLKTRVCSTGQPVPTCSYNITTSPVSVSCGSNATLRADCKGDNCDKVQYAWSGQGLSKSGQSVSFAPPAINGIYSYTVTASRQGCAPKTAVATVTVTSCSPTPVPCSFSITAASTSVSCGSSVSLKAECMSNNCDNITYTWAGQGLGKNGKSVDFTAPTTNGTYSYTVTATKAGCTPQTAVATVTVSGCAPAQKPCSFSITTTSASVRCDSMVTLWADCRGSNCDQVKYLWTGQQVNLTSKSVTFTPPSANGIYYYVVTATAADCSPVSATAAVTVTNCATAPVPTPCSFSIVARASSASVSCGSSVNLQADCLSDNCDLVQYAWAGQGLSKSGKSVDFTAPTTNGTYSYTVTATKPGCDPKTTVVTVTVTGCAAQPTPCSFTLYTPSTSINCRSSVTLRTYCQGDNCDQIQYAWAGPNLNQSGQSVSFAPPTANGVYNYTVTATQPNCATQTSVASVTVSGCAPPPVTCSFSIAANSANVSCGSSVTLKADCMSDYCDLVQYAWAGPGLNKSGKSVTFTAPTTNGVYTYTVTATKTDCSIQTAVATVTVTGCTAAPTPCSFTVVANSPTVNCSSPVTLNADCRSNNCDNITYTWSGAGINQNGQSINFTAPNTNGTYSYTVTATRPDCSPQTAVATVTVTGCNTAPPDNGGYPVLNSPPPADKRPILQNERIRVAVDLGVGGVIREVTDLQVGENMINCMVKGDGVRDPGRDDQISLYSLPSDSKNWTVNNKPVLEDIGYNPVQGGDVAGNFSPMLGYGRTDKVLYTKTRGLHWGINNEPGDYVVEQWIRLEGNIVRRHVKITGDRPDQTNYADCRQQELPCTYTNSAYYQYYVVQGEPYSGAPLVNVNTIPNLTGNGPLTRHVGGTTGPYNIDSSEPWVVAVRPNSNRGLALHTPYSHEFKVGLFNEIGYGPAESSGAGYIANGMSLILDRNGVYEFDINMVVGTLDEIRSTINSLPRSETKPSYVFAGQATRHGFYYRKAYDQGYPVGNELVITPTDRRFKIVSPRKAYRASETNTLYVRMRAKTPETKMILEWRKIGQTELQAAQAGQMITFSVTPDNQYHTIAIPTKNHPLWNGLINEFQLRYTNQTETPVSGHEIGLKWISADNLGDQ